MPKKAIALGIAVVPLCYLWLCVDAVEADPGVAVPEADVPVGRAPTAGQQPGLPRTPRQRLQQIRD